MHSLARHPLPLALCLLALTAHCGSNVHSDKDARNAYLGLDKAIDRALSLGMTGFNSASSANIPSQTGSGDVSGMMTVTGQVDQGSSSNKGMRLLVALVSYADTAVASDSPKVTYDSGTNSPGNLDLSLKNIPNGTFSGTLNGTYTMKGDLTGPVTLSLTFDGKLEPVPGGGANEVRRVAGQTTVSGTASSFAGGYVVSLVH